MYLHRTIATVSVVAVLIVSILIWVSILDDDSISSESFVGIQLGEALQLLKFAIALNYCIWIHSMNLTLLCTLNFVINFVHII